MSKRSYNQRKRAEQQEQTRQKIVEATAALHEEVGPAATTVSAIAARAGVQRLTVYRHFADDAALFAACSGHVMAARPFPDPARWAVIDDPDERLRVALGALYGYYRSGEQMLTHVLRDAEKLPALAEVLAPMQDYLRAVVESLAEARPAGDHRLLLAALHHAIQFWTWRTLTAQGLDQDEAIELMVRFVVAAEPAHPRRHEAESRGHG
jgi:AcrR family transcriptional regulator